MHASFSPCTVWTLASGCPVVHTGVKDVRLARWATFALPFGSESALRLHNFAA